MIEGCREWQAKGLQPPEIVKEATALYFEAEDAIAAWIEECCERDPQAWAAGTLSTPVGRRGRFGRASPSDRRRSSSRRWRHAFRPQRRHAGAASPDSRSSDAGARGRVTCVTSSHIDLYARACSDNRTT